MTQPADSRQYLRMVIAIFIALVVIVMAIAAYRYATPEPEADIHETQLDKGAGR